MKKPRVQYCEAGYAYGYCGQGSSTAFRELDTDTRDVAEPMMNEGLRHSGRKGQKAADRVEHKWFVANLLAEREDKCSN